MTDEMKNNEMKINEVTEEQLEGVAGGKIQWADAGIANLMKG